ncbi:hypothetical protein LXL04_029761 [Taraxacum kok-saghyz]
MLGKLSQDPQHLVILLHNRPGVNHLVTHEVTDKKLLTRSIFRHVFGPQIVSQFLSRFNILIDIKEGIRHTIEDVATTYVIIILPLGSLPGLFQCFIFIKLRHEGTQNVHHFPGSEKKVHLLLPSSEVLPFKLLQLVKLACHVVDRISTSHDHRIFQSLLDMGTTPAKGAAPWTPPEAAAPDPAVRGLPPPNPRSTQASERTLTSVHSAPSVLVITHNKLASFIKLVNTAEETLAVEALEGGELPCSRFVSFSDRSIGKNPLRQPANWFQIC